MLIARPISRGAVVIAMFSLLSSVSLLRRTVSDREHQNGTELGAFKRRISVVKSQLPSDAIVGYISDLKADPSQRSLLELRMTQYVLAPVIVEDNTTQYYVIGNFHGPVTDQTPELHGLAIIKDFGNGVLLLRGARQ
jgi:hypothetical protein